MSIKRLLRESNPPAGMLASPVPQYEDVSTGEPGAVKGRYGAPFSMLLGPDGQPIDPSNPLEVRVRELETELQELRQLLQSGDTKVQLMGRARLVAMGLNEVIPPGVEIFRPGAGEAPVIQAHRRYGFILTFVATPEEKRRARVNLALRRLAPDGSKSGSSEYVMGTRVDVLVADGSQGTPLSLIMEPVHVPAEWINFGILNTGTEDVTTNWYLVEV